MAATGMAKAAGIWAGGLLLGLSLPYLPSLPSSSLMSVMGGLPVPDYPSVFAFRKTNAAVDTTEDSTTDAAEEARTAEDQTAAEQSAQEQTPAPFVCDTSHAYRTELISLDPLLIYIHGLVTPAEAASLLATAEPRFAPSRVTKGGRQQHTPDRTSSTAGLPRDDAAVACVLGRARGFLGTLLRDGWDEMGPPQLVRYGPGERFNVHHDWFGAPQRAGDGSGRRWNRVASFFAVLEDRCTGGETHFPFVDAIAPPSPRGEGMWQGGDTKAKGEQGEEGEAAAPLWRRHEDGGLAIRPVAGNAVFWVNLHANGTGDPRTNHAGLPLVSGRKTAMNIWPRHYYAYD